MKNTLTIEELRQFEELGFVGPFTLIEPRNVDSLTRELKESVKKNCFGDNLQKIL